MTTTPWCVCGGVVIILCKYNCNTLYVQFQQRNYETHKETQKYDLEKEKKRAVNKTVPEEAQTDAGLLRQRL